MTGPWTCEARLPTRRRGRQCQQWCYHLCSLFTGLSRKPGFSGCLPEEESAFLMPQCAVSLCREAGTRMPGIMGVKHLGESPGQRWIWF
uniref:Uncharacterized protein n=1 Tax=Setaria italica TaxID=4555 RepID=K3Y363_SETIT